MSDVIPVTSAVIVADVYDGDESDSNNSGIGGMVDNNNGVASIIGSNIVAAGCTNQWLIVNSDHSSDSGAVTIPVETSPSPPPQALLQPEVVTAETTAIENQPSSPALCRFNQLGICRFGDLCRFRHAPINGIVDDDNCDGQDDVEVIINDDMEEFKNSVCNDGVLVNDLDSECSMVQNCPTTSTLLVNGNDGDQTTPTCGTNINSIDPNSWVMAPVFVPKYISQQQQQSPSTLANPNIVQQLTVADAPPKSYAEVVGKRFDSKQGADNDSGELMMISGAATGRLLCPYIRDGNANCRYGDACVYDHGLMCDMCGVFCLHPTNATQRKTHQNACIQQHEADMEISFAIARSKDKTCGVCFEIIMEKAGREQRFGILPNCNHIFCLECIRKWRKAKQFDSKIIRACPECRVTSDFVCPSAYWVETKEDKEKLIVDYQKALGEKDCKYFKQGQGQCPFGNKCFYKHALPNGMKIDVGVPQRQVRRHNHLGEVDVLQQLFLWDFLDDRDQQWLDELASILSDEGIDDYDPWI